jgi:hypothetical protein
MDWIVLDNVKPYNGRYPFDIFDDGTELTTREWGWIKKFSGYLPLTVSAGYRGGDAELFATFALVALHRAGKVAPPDLQACYDRISDAPFGTTITIEENPVEADADPPPEQTAARPSSSGGGSTTSSESSTSPRNGSGTPASATSPLPPVRSGI